MPVQRIPRYSLLLQDLLNHTWRDHPDYTNIEKALEATKKVATHVNSSISKANNMQMIASLQQSLGSDCPVCKYNPLLNVN